MSAYEEGDESRAVLEERRWGGMERRVSNLESSYLDNTAKITTLINGFNELNKTLTSLTASINTAVKTVMLSAAFLTTSVAGLWGYHTYITAQIEHHTTSMITNSRD